MYTGLQIGMYLLKILAVVIIIKEMYSGTDKAEKELRLKNSLKYVQITACGLAAVLLAECAGRLVFYGVIEKSYLLASGTAAGETNLLCSYLPFYLIMAAGCVFLYLYKRYKKKEIVKNAAIYPVFLVGQFLIWLGYIQGAGQRAGESILFFHLGFLAGAAADVILLYMVFEKTRKDRLERELNKMEAAHELKKEHYENVTRLQREMISIKQELSGQLDRLCWFMEQPDQQEMVKKQLEEMTHRIESTRITNYTPLPVLNAVLEEKAQTCREKGISLKTDIRLEKDHGIDKVHLCSIFSNLLDNAVNACELLPGETEKEIWVYAVVMQDYLYIKTTNPCVNQKAKVKRNWHGYGIKIMQEISRKYNGIYQADVKNGVYTALVTLQVGENS